MLEYSHLSINFTNIRQNPLHIRDSRFRAFSPFILHSKQARKDVCLAPPIACMIFHSFRIEMVFRAATFAVTE